MLDVKRLARHTSEKRKRGDTEYIKIDPTNAEDLKRLPKDMVDEQRPFREGDLIGVCSAHEAVQMQKFQLFQWD